MKKIIDLVTKQGIFSLFYTAIIVTFLLIILTITTQVRITESNTWVNHTYQVLQETEKLLSYLKDAETGQRGFLLTGKAAYLEPYNQSKNHTYQTLTKLQLLTQDNVEQQQRLLLIEKGITEKFSELALTIQLREEKDLDTALQVVNSGKGKQLMDNLRMELSRFETTEKTLLEERSEALATSTYNIQAIQSIAGLLIVAILVFTIGLLKKAINKQKVLFATIDTQNRALLMNVDEDDSLSTALTEDKAVEKLITNLRNATEFIKQIGKGHYDAQLKGVTQENMHLNKDNLAGSLLQMCDKLKQVAEEDKKRNWATQGLAQFGEILRIKSNNLEELSFTVISALVKYVKANQGGLFILNDADENNIQLEMRASYAFDKKKYIKKTIQIGEGLVGQAVQEADTIYLSEVPQDHIRITSGLGTANPRSIVIVPLKLNDKVLGAIELASFQMFNRHEIDFIEKVAESIASTLATVKANEQTKLLLEMAQQQTEQLRAQEEEMRQNVEELEASQEETVRKGKEMERLLEEAQKREAMMKEQEIMMRASMEELALLQQKMYEKDRRQVKEIEDLQLSYQEKENEMREIMMEMKINEEDMQQNEDNYRKLMVEFQTSQLELQEKIAFMEQLKKENNELKKLINNRPTLSA